MYIIGSWLYICISGAKGQDIEMQLKVVRSGFARAKTKQKAAEGNLRSCHGTQQAALNELVFSWRGTGGTAFRECTEEVSNQTLTGVLLISTLNMQTESTERNFVQTDRTSSRILSD